MLLILSEQLLVQAIIEGVVRFLAIFALGYFFRYLLEQRKDATHHDAESDVPAHYVLEPITEGDYEYTPADNFAYYDEEEFAIAIDELTVIRMLTPDHEQRLNDSGITTYEQLAHASVGTILEICGMQMDQSEIALSWVEQARLLSQERFEEFESYVHNRENEGRD